MGVLQIDFETGTIVTPEWLDRMQEVNAGLIWNAELQWAGNTISVSAGTGNAAACININGRMRYNESTVSKTFTGADAAGTYAVYATTSNDDTATTFALDFRTSGTPSAAHYRLIGSVVWNGSSITSVLRSNTPAAVKHGFQHTLANDPLPASSIGTSQLVDAAVTPAKLSAQAQGVPLGVVFFVISTFLDVPAGYLVANGQTVTSSSHPALYALLVARSNPFGVTSGNPRIPDLRGRTIIGAGQGTGLTNRNLGDTPGAESLPSHVHTYSGKTTLNGQHIHFQNFNNGQSGTEYGVMDGFNNSSSGNIATQPAGNHEHNYSGTTAPAGSGNHGVMQPSLALVPIVRAY